MPDRTVTPEESLNFLETAEIGVVARLHFNDGSGSEIALKTTSGWVGERGPIRRRALRAFHPVVPLRLFAQTGPLNLIEDSRVLGTLYRDGKGVRR